MRRYVSMAMKTASLKKEVRASRRGGRARITGEMVSQVVARVLDTSDASFDLGGS